MHESRGTFDFLAVDEGSVTALQILNDELIAFFHDFRVLTRNHVGIDLECTFGMPSDDGFSSRQFKRNRLTFLQQDDLCHYQCPEFIKERTWISEDSMNQTQITKGHHPGQQHQSLISIWSDIKNGFYISSQYLPSECQCPAFTPFPGNHEVLSQNSR